MDDTKINSYVEGVDNETYHSDKKYLSSSQLKKAIKSHGTFRYEMNKPRVQKKWDKDNAMDLGSLVHCLLLEPHMLDKEFAFIDVEGKNFRTKVDKQYLAQVLDFHKDKIVLTNCRRRIADIMVKNVMKHPFFRRLLDAPGKPEMSGYFRDSFYNLDLRFRPDRKIFDLDGKPAILDVKTTRDMDTFIKAAKWDFDYDLSAYMYLEGDKQVTGDSDVPFYFGVVESQAPYRVAVYKASDAFLAQGRRKYVQAMSNVNLANNKEILTDSRFQEVDFEEI